MAEAETPINQAVEQAQAPAPTPFAQASQNADPFAAVATEASPAADEPHQAITWTASEFIAHEKGFSWYAGLAAVAVIFAVLIWIVTKDKVSIVVVFVAALFLGIYAARKPRQLEYNLDHQGITVGGKHYPYETFRSFSVIPEGAFSSIIFMPMKRFAFPLTLYHAPDDEDGIVEILSGQLPLDHHKPDTIDKLMRKIRF